jgi:hypothetical protein
MVLRRPLLLAAMAVIGSAAAVAPRAALASAPMPAAPACALFPADNVWNTDISSLPVNSHSGSWIGSMGGTSRLLHPDFGSSDDPSAPYGIPYTVVESSHPVVNVAFEYADESDTGPYPLGSDTLIEGGVNAGGDRHALIVNKDTCTDYELYDTHYNASGSTAGSGAIFNLNSDALRPDSWTSADAAGLPILPGLLRPDEVAAGSVTHAVRVTAQMTDASHIWPARHDAGSAANANLPPMGARFRLKAGVDLSGYSAQTRTVLSAFKHYGLIVADNGSNWYFQGSASNSWDGTLISELKSIPAGDFEAVDESSLVVRADSGATNAAVANGLLRNLVRYDSPALGHWVTTGPVSDGFTGTSGRVEMSFGMTAASPAAGMRELFGCLAGSVHFLSLDSGCERQTRLASEGFVASQSSSRYPVAVYRCVVPSTNDHFASSSSSCEGQRDEGLLGYTADRSQLTRNLSPSTGSHWSAVGDPGSAFRAEVHFGFLGSAPAAGRAALYECAAGRDLFTSLDPHCEGQRRFGSLGFIAISQPEGAVALFRCWTGIGHFDTTSSSCEGAGRAEGRLGYVLTQA